MDSMVLRAIALIVPAAIIFGYWLIARHQVRRATAEVYSHLEEEQALRARVSHQVRDPLTVIYGFSEALLDTGLDDPNEIRSVVSTINAEALAVSRTVENLVTATQVENQDLRPRSIPFEPAKEVGRAVTPFRRLGANISVDSPDVAGQGDPVLFRQIVQNLISNAVRHGGSEISVVAVLQDGSYMCTVADDGAGLPDWIASNLFSSIASHSDDAEDAIQDDDSPAPDPKLDTVRTIEPSTDDGLQIGLPISIALAGELGGSLDYELTHGAAMFTLTLPTDGWPDPPAPTTAATVDTVEERHATEDEHAENSKPQVDDEADFLRFDDVDESVDKHEDAGEPGDTEVLSELEPSVEAGTHP
jgi:two-component sensor histidine kinase